jgi:hypothetical protein
MPSAPVRGATGISCHIRGVSVQLGDIIVVPDGSRPTIPSNAAQNLP